MTDLKPLTEGRQKLFGPDGLHPSVKGAALIAEEIDQTDKMKEVFRMSKKLIALGVAAVAAVCAVESVLATKMANKEKERREAAAKLEAEEQPETESKPESEDQPENDA